MNKPTFVYVTYIATTPEQLWQALTDPSFTQQYWGGRRIESEWKVGSRIRHLKSDVDFEWEGEVLRAEPPRVLSYTFHVQMNQYTRDEAPSRVTFEITPEEDRGVVRLTVTHDQFEPDSTVYPGIQHGWPAILSGLKTLLETGRALPGSSDWR